MKKKLFSLFLALTLCLGVAAPAMAAEIWEYGSRDFREGVKPVLVDEKWNYVDENGQVVDLNRGRFDYAYDFYEGRAAVIDANGKVGYIDRSGNLVIPCQYGSFANNGEMWTGRFRDGKATVLKNSAMSEGGFMEPYVLGTWEIGKVDLNGKLVEPFTAVDMGDNFYGKGLYLLSDFGVTSEYDEYEYEEPIVSEPTKYQSIAKLTRVDVSEMDFNGFTVEITNSGDAVDTGTVALVAASHLGTVHFIDYELAPHSTQSYQLLVSGHIGTEYGRLSFISGAERFLNFTIITFKSDQDVSEFKSTIPQEVSTHHSGIVDWNKEHGALTLCNGTPGDEWLKMVGIGRKGQPFIYPDEDHSRCRH